MAEPIKQKTAAPAERGVRFILRALQYRNYRLYFAGQGISLIGTWMQQVAMGWLVYRLTNSPFLLGTTAFFSQIPHLFLGPFAGVLIDRFNKHRMLIITQILSTGQAVILSFLVLSGSIRVGHIIPLVFYLGLVNAVDMPLRQSFVIYLVEKKDLNNAIALNSAMFNSARLIGPSIAGILIAVVGEGWCFLINAISFLAVIFALLAMRLPPPARSPRTKQFLRGLREGITYALEHHSIRAILLLVIGTALSGLTYPVLMPIFARDILHGGPRGLGLILAGIGSGALIGAYLLASRSNAANLFDNIPRASVFLGSGLIAFAFSRQLIISLALSLFIGFGMMMQMVSCNTVLQTIVEDNKRGRVMSLYTTAFMGFTPLGSLMIGALAQQIGASWAMMLCGLIILGIAFLFYRSLPLLSREVDFLYQRSFRPTDASLIVEKSEEV